MAASFEQFVDSSTPRLVRTARLLLGSASESQDLVQETLIVMFRRWGRLRDPAAADAYAHTTLVHLARRHLRRARFRHEWPPDSGFTDDYESDAAALMPESNPEVTDALALLPLRQRETVVLRYYLDLSVEETARTMRCSVGTVKSQTAKALDSLRGHLEDRDRSKVGDL